MKEKDNAITSDCIYISKTIISKLGKKLQG